MAQKLVTSPGDVLGAANKAAAAYRASVVARAAADAAAVEFRRLRDKAEDLEDKSQQAEADLRAAVRKLVPALPEVATPDPTGETK